VRLKKSLLILGLFFMLSGCATTNNFIFDESLPKEEQCTLEILSEITVTEFNGTKVNWAPDVFWGSTKAVVTIPAGKNTLTMNYTSYSNNGSYITTYTLKDHKIEFDFQQGGVYTILPLRNAYYVTIEIVKMN